MEPPSNARSETAPEAGTVVVGYDGSGLARGAFRYAARRLTLGGRLVAVHAIAPPSEFIDTPPYDHRLDRERARGKDILEGLDAQPVDGAEVLTEVVEGHAAAALAEAAERHRAEEIVVGSRGAGRVRTALGSVAHDLVHEADRPVVIVPREAVQRGLTREPHAEAHRADRVTVVGYDGSESAKAALTYAAWRNGGLGQIVAIYALGLLPAAPGDDRTMALTASERHLQQEEREGRAVLETIPAEIQAQRSLEQEVRHGPAEQALVGVGRERGAEEIVVGSRGLGRIRGALGSVSHALLHLADRPVVIVPERVADRQAVEEVQELVE